MVLDGVFVSLSVMCGLVLSNAINSIYGFDGIGSAGIVVTVITFGTVITLGLNRERRMRKLE